MPTENPGLETLQERIGYSFDDVSLLLRALTHPSYIQQYPDAGEHNQRLEFLGDSVLGLILAEALYEALPEKREGVLTRNRAALAKGSELSTLARALDLGPHVLLSDAEVNNGGRERDSILEDALEALIGAIYLDSDFHSVRHTVLGWYGDISDRLGNLIDAHNPKGKLQELLQPQMGNGAVQYEIIDTSGPDHMKQFRVRVSVAGEPFGIGEGNSKKEAEEQAAREALSRIEAEGLPQPPGS